MTRAKIDFGIDLGTTNSAIAVMTSGNAAVKKSKGGGKDTTPSAVSFSKNKRVKAGDAGLALYEKELLKNKVEEGMNSFVEFKRTMGTDKQYTSSRMGRSWSSEELSAEVIKLLRSYVQDEGVNAAVITVPNQFRQNQIDATQRAAELAGLECFELLQEPIAASMAYGVRAESMQGYWVVFDFGGGTFDAALMKVDEGVMKVVDTGGDNHLGGKDLDIAIVDRVIIPKLQSEYSLAEALADPARSEILRARIKQGAEMIKIELSTAEVSDWEPEDPLKDDDGEDILPEISVTLAEFEEAVEPIFGKAISITKELIRKNGLSNSDLDAILLVGGPTMSQTLRRMLREEFGDKVDSSADPMTSVAVGAALFAGTRDIPADLIVRDSAKVQLSLKYPETTVETEEHLGVRIERDRTEGEVPDVLFAEIEREDGGWNSGKVEITDAEIIDLALVAGKTNTFKVQLADEQGNHLEAQPSSFVIIQGLTVASSTLPYSMCIDSLLTGSGKQRLVLLEGLERNTSLPAKGKSVFRTQNQIRPGNTEDVLRIPFIEGNPGERAIHNQESGVVTLSGEDFPEFLPEGSEVEVTASIDTSRRIVVEVYFPYIDETIEQHLTGRHDTEQQGRGLEELRSEIRKAHHALNMLHGPHAVELGSQLDALMENLDAGQNDYDTKMRVFENLRSALKEIDKLEEEGEWPASEAALGDELKRLKAVDEQYGNSETAGAVAQLEAAIPSVLREQNVKLANELVQQMGTLSFSLIRNEAGLWISYVKSFDDDFDSQDWTNQAQARRLIDEAKSIIATSPSREKIEAKVLALFELLPDKSMPLGAADSDLLVK